MQKRKLWQFYLIVAVTILTIYNILPTVFYYAKPLNDSITAPRAEKISLSIAKRVNDLEAQSKDWVYSFCKLLKIKPKSVSLDADNPKQIQIAFNNLDDAKIFQQLLPRAGSLIPFAPAQLTSIPQELTEDSLTITIQRKIPIHFDLSHLNRFFQFGEKRAADGSVSPEYKSIIFDRMAHLGSIIGGPSDAAYMAEIIISQPQAPSRREFIFTLAHDMVDFADIFGDSSPATARFLASFNQNTSSKQTVTAASLGSAMSQMRDELKLQKATLQRQEQKDGLVQQDLQTQIRQLQKQEDLLIKAENLIKKNSSSFAKASTSWTYATLYTFLENEELAPAKLQSIPMEGKNPFIREISIDWANDNVYLNLYDDVLAKDEELTDAKKNQYQQLLINEIARITQRTNEKISAVGKGDFAINLDELTNSNSFLIFKLNELAQVESQQTENLITSNWNPTHPELTANAYPVWNYATYQTLSPEKRSLGLVVIAPTADDKATLRGLKPQSIYVVAKGANRILQKYQKDPENPQAKQFIEDFDKLKHLLMESGFTAYRGEEIKSSPEFVNDIIFESPSFYKVLLAATREDFTVHGSKKFALLEFTNVEQRILTTNKIQTQIHEDLLKWKDDYNAAQVKIDPRMRYDVPAPTQSPLWSNIALSARKYFRGDDRKILHWGLDLSGGKTVQIELRDQNNRVVTQPADLNQGMNELYNRVNKMGVSDVSIRLVGSNIVLDFPGSQGLSAAELVKASTMYFHIVNEKFSDMNKPLADHVQRFLQEIWNEALVTNRKDIDSINSIAWKHLYGEGLTVQDAEPRSESAKVLLESGLMFKSPLDPSMSSDFDDTISKIAVLRGDDYTQWHGHSHPLIIVFNNYALEGSNLTNIRGSYDPSKGNFLSFEVKGSASHSDGEKYSPRDELYSWTSRFSKEKIAGTPLEALTSGRGWRMAVILNDTIISSPHLEAALKDQAMITGGFSQREVNQLMADLKAGSLSFTPHILSEKNISPDLGKSERIKGIAATFLALILVVIAMVSYYRFAGVVASAAVFFNLIIMWATLQNIQATLSLAGIAGVILTVGMAVDANVLVFERIKEEFAISGKIASAIMSGYRRAFSAILDSNVTTIIAALILLNFDAGPIKGFAITLIIGIASSMFTALFLTKYFFMGWLKNPKNKSLTMSNIVTSTNFDFLKASRYVFLFSAIVIVLGSFALVKEKKSIFGMDFTGGFEVNVELQEKDQVNYRQEVEAALIAKGANVQDFQIRELNPSNNIRILLGTAMELPSKPFYQMPIETDELDITYPYENNPRISWVVDALQSKELSLTTRSLSTVDSGWTVMSGQMSDSMRNNALIGLLLALVAILIYITIRFEFKFAFSAMLCLVHDVLITIGTIAILHIFGVSIQIDLNTVAALMTIIGYSLNDTIIIFDRIREELKLYKKMTFRDVVNHSLNATLSRTTLTSGTTLLVLLALVLFGGSTVFGFALVMLLGVIFGTLSSIFIASPLMLMLHTREERKEK